MSHPRTRLARPGLIPSVLACVPLVLAACSGTVSPSPTTAPPTSGGATPSAQGSASASPFALPAPEKTTLNIGISTPTEPIQFAAKLADDLGYYKDLGFTTVNVTGFEGDAKVVQALVAGALDVGLNGVTSPISSQTTDAPLSVFAVSGVKLTDDFVCTKDIKTVADVKGKKVAISTFGGTSHGSVLVSLQIMNLQPSDVTITQIGGQSVRIDALKSGAVGCAVVDVSLEQQMKDAGFNILANELQAPVQWARSTIDATKDFIAKNPNTILDVTAAILKAQNYMFDSKNFADVEQKFADFSQQKLADVKTPVDSFPTYANQALGWTDQAFTIPRDTLATVQANVKDVDVTKAYDKTFLQKLYDNGNSPQIGDPAKPV